jgi:hypothetical protein
VVASHPSPKQAEASESQIKFARNPAPNTAFRQTRLRQNAVSGFQINGLGFLHGRLSGDIARFWSKVREALDRLDANTTTDGWSI